MEKSPFSPVTENKQEQGPQQPKIIRELEKHIAGGWPLQEVQEFLFRNLNSRNDYNAVISYIVSRTADADFKPYAGALIDQIGQNGQMIAPEIWIESMADLFSTPGVSGSTKSYALSATNYIMSFYKGHITETLKHADLNNIESYDRTGKFIKFLFYLGKQAEGWGFSERVFEDMKQILGQVSQPEPNKNYLLTKFAEGALKELAGEEGKKSVGQPWFPIQKNQYGGVYEDGYLHVSDPADFNTLVRKIDTVEAAFKSTFSEQDTKRMAEIAEEIAELTNKVNALSDFPNDDAKASLMIDKIDALDDERNDLIVKNNPDILLDLRKKQQDTQAIQTLISKNLVTPDSLANTVPGVPKDQIQKLYSDYVFMLDSTMREVLKTEFNRDLFSLSIAEQLYFLNYLKTITVKDAEKIKTFCGTYGIDGLRVFLSTAHGGSNMADNIFILGNKLPEQSTKILFGKYAEIIDEASRVSENLKVLLGENMSPGIVSSVQEHLLVRGKELLAKYAEQADVCRDIECQDLGRKLEEKLADLKASLLLFAGACKTLAEKGEFDFEDFKNVSLDLEKGMLSDDTKTEMKKIFLANREQYSPTLLKEVATDFEQNLSDPKEHQLYYILRYKNEITAFMRLDEQADGSVYGASFNVRPELRGSAIGTELLKEIIEKESASRPFRAICYEKNPMLKRYVSDFGFEIVGTLTDYHGTGETFFEMLRKPTRS